MTSSYYQDSSCSLAEYGLSRDRRKDNNLLLLALGVTKEGFPFYWKVLPGGVGDCLRVSKAVDCFKRDIRIENFIVVMDKGMLSNENIEFLEKKGIFYITTIGKHRIRKLADFPFDLLKEIGEKIEKNKNIEEIMKDYPYFNYFSTRAYYKELSQQGKRRYILCFNPEKLLEERRQREEKIKSICRYLEKWNKKLKKARYKKDEKKIEKEIYAYLKKNKSENYFKIKFERNKINWQLNYEKLQKIELQDGIWCILTNLPKDKKVDFLISSYLKRRKGQVPFHYLKGFIEIRPFYHHKEEPVKAHITLCILAYLLEVSLEYLLKESGYKFTYQEFMDRVRNIKAVEVEIKSRKEKNIKLTEIPEEINEILMTLKIGEINEENFIKKLI
ncbi:MAG: IS1634 family transposase [Brevinematia bacterium]